MITDAEIESRMDYLGLTTNRVTIKQINSKIKNEMYYHFPNTTSIVCCLVLENGFTVIGESACANEENFNEEIGKSIAKENARQKIWALEGYLLKEKLNSEN